jgi:hypothetical protein
MRDARHKRIVLFVILGLFFVQAVAEPWFVYGSDEERLWRLACIIVNAIVITQWFLIDAHQHGFRFSKPMLLMLVAANFLVAPWYLWKTRGKQVWRTLLKLAGYVLLAVVVTVAGQALGEYIHPAPAPLVSPEFED